MSGTHNRIVLIIAILFSLMLSSCQIFKPQLPEKVFYKDRNIFQPGEYGPECHSSTITELTNGDLLAAWWSGSYEGATDVVIKLARLPFGADSWGKAETVADIPDRFEGNPVLFSLPDGRIWLFFIVRDPNAPGMVQTLFRESRDLGYTWSPTEKFVTDPGIRTRNHPIMMKNGEILFPLFDQLSGQSKFLISGDLGQTWILSNAIISDPLNAQPTVIQREDGELYALMRTWHEDPVKRFLWQSESKDYGRTWSAPTYSRVPAVSSAIEMIKLENSHLVLAFNNGKERERTPLKLALSLDDGRTWAYHRILESGEGSFSYPSLVQSRNAHIHVTYSYNRKFIKHVEVNEAWIRAGEVSAR